MFAVIKTGGKQYRVAADDVITIARLDAEPGKTVTFDEVAMFSGDGGTTIGAPAVKGVTVAGEVVEQTRGPKVIAFKKRRRKNSRRKRGHRQDLTVVRITEILTGGAKPAMSAARAEAAPAPERAAAAADRVSEAAPSAAEETIEAAPKKPRAPRARTKKAEGGEPSE
jgi:large subunit ribosomal protein L21